MTLDLLHAVVEGRSLSEEQAESAMRGLLSGQSTPVLTASFLTALRMRGETVDELAGFARAMRAAALTIPIAPECRPLIDTCGTGGNGTSTFNISTACAFVVAGAGVRVAKHGNRSITSQCGSADVLEALGVRTSLTPELVANTIRDVGVGFVFAPAFHSAVKHVQPVRIEMKFRTAFNFLGPLTNPARAEFQLAGTWSDEAAGKIAGALARLGLERGFTVHGSDGLGEATVRGPSTIFEIRRGGVTETTVVPEDFGLPVQRADELQGGTAELNRVIIEAVLAGERGAHRDIVLMNAGLALVAASMAASFLEGAERAAESIDSGAARRKLDQLREVSQAG